MLDEELLMKLKDYNSERYFFNNNDMNFEINKDYERILKARYNKISRIKQHFIWLYHNRKNLYFITFTFDEQYIKKCDRTRKDLIKNSLTSFDENGLIILNIDYGKQNERLHYHCVFGTDSDLNLKNFLDLFYPCFTYTEAIRQDCNSIKKISKYINKLSNHAVKDSTKNSRIFFNFKGYGPFHKDCPEVRIRYLEDKELVGLT